MLDALDAAAALAVAAAAVDGAGADAPGVPGVPAVGADAAAPTETPDGNAVPVSPELAAFVSFPDLYGGASVNRNVDKHPTAGARTPNTHDGQNVSV